MPKIYLEIHGYVGESTRTDFAALQIEYKRFSFNVPFEDSPDARVMVEIFCPPSIFESVKKRPLATTAASAYEFEDASIKTSCEREVSDDFLSALNSGINTESKLPSVTLQEELKRLYYGMLNATNEALLLIKYGLHFPNVSESPLQGPSTLYWSLDGSEWNYITLTIHLRGSLDFDEVKLDNETETLIQSYIDTGFSPFFALAPLHRAINERDPRYKVIYAAYAAELAIKEFLIEYTKKKYTKKDENGDSPLVNSPVESLLLELPSPPLQTLYGEVLKSYTGKGAPKYNEMGALNRERNSLMHKPPREDGGIELAKAEKYVYDAEGAIFHLLNLLFESDPIIKRLNKKYNKKHQDQKAS